MNDKSTEQRVTILIGTRKLGNKNNEKGSKTIPVYNTTQREVTRKIRKALFQ